MKYMGSKRAMLTNGLGELLQQVLNDRQRFVDLFVGSGAVAKFVAARRDIPVLAVDLQRYAVLLTGAVIHRTAPLRTADLWTSWVARASDWLGREAGVLDFAQALALTHTPAFSSARFLLNVQLVREACELLPTSFPLARAYGGHYFGLEQAIWLEALRQTVPSGPAEEVAVAALIESASECSASPGHTAQPFSPTKQGMPHLFGAWSRSIAGRTERRFEQLGAQCALVKGRSMVGDAVQVAGELKESDLVFVDPPYSEVQYSRFYHVLESVADGRVGVVSGVGRYPAIDQRPQSNFSRKAPAVHEFERLMAAIAHSGAHALVTFPEAEASNGLSGKQVEQISAQFFKVVRRVVESTFSTLGGTGATRSARQGTKELILQLVPR